MIKISIIKLHNIQTYSTLGCHGLLRISNNLSSRYIARFLSYQILAGYSLKIVFYIPEISIVFIWVERCLLLPCHLTTDLIREWGATLAQVKHSVSETQTFNWYSIFPQNDFKDLSNLEQVVWYFIKCFPFNGQQESDWHGIYTSYELWE